MTENEKLLNIEAIRQLKARRLRAIDAKEWDVYTSLHCEDHVSDTYGGAVMASAAENTKKLADFVTGMVTVHHVHSYEIEFQSDTEATGIWCMEDRLWWLQAEQPHWLHGFGYYHERYRFEDGLWKFCYRRLERTKVILSNGGDMQLRQRSGT